ncbi:MULTISPECIES: 3-hydroxyacyl-CoA dehydrogenase family protein [Microbacterium]|uniref:3-hydroxyacyl-CoA dehydrogenase family protein n=1 Tax=Microbacterium TaxID=33882 RepID=UPI0027842A96|nr:MULTISPECIES: 3-hydroxyacyl-CoA dehydrogenase NAD-binding domain-containing protein [Microbacterium]MDQ1075232.1 3-hydroxybutyryl-CoA dehydrogenase [Microbacterium sp. SORGH_AS_0969]MDQ1115463.1 3-hydroxybutyryl-CoA dehydrogenase [Microbacterium testaceum]
MSGPVAVLGAGTMGAGIAAVLAAHGREVRLYSRTTSTLEAARELIAAHDGDARVTTTTDLDEAVRGAVLVVESVAEDLALKREIFARIESLVATDAVLTTNTSSVRITEIAEALTDPARLVGLHWFNPPTVMPLIEIVRGERTSDATVQAAQDLCAAIGRESIVVDRDVPGFVVNRLQYALLREAIALVEGGIATVADVDRAVSTTLAPRWSSLGPLGLMDLAGLDVVEKVSGILMSDLDATGTVPRTVAALVAEGHLGAKSGRGFYPWSPADADRARADRDALVRLITEERR